MRKEKEDRMHFDIFLLKFLNLLKVRKISLKYMWLCFAIWNRFIIYNNAMFSCLIFLIEFKLFFDNYINNSFVLLF